MRMRKQDMEIYKALEYRISTRINDIVNENVSYISFTDGLSVGYVDSALNMALWTDTLTMAERDVITSQLKEIYDSHRQHHKR